MTIDTGGPAYPHPDYLHEGEPGMTWLDACAMRATQPGMSEICAVAGKSYRAGEVWDGPHTSLGRFDSWWDSILLDDRMAMFAKVKYAEARAMLAEKRHIEGEQP